MLTVQAKDCSKLTFRVKKTMTMLTLKKKYSAHMGLPIILLRFYSSSHEEINDNETPTSLNMKQNEVIHMWLKESLRVLYKKLTLDHEEHKFKFEVWKKVYGRMNLEKEK